MLLTNYIPNSVWGSFPSAHINLVRVRERSRGISPNLRNNPRINRYVVNWELTR